MPQAALRNAGGATRRCAARAEAAPGLACDGVAPGRTAQEEIKDLLAPEGGPPPAVHIREVRGGGVCLVGAAEKEVGCKAEMAAVLEQVRGARGRAGRWGRAARWEGLGVGKGWALGRAGRWEWLGAGAGPSAGQGLGAGKAWALGSGERWHGLGAAGWPGRGRAAWARPGGLAAAC